MLTPKRRGEMKNLMEKRAEEKEEGEIYESIPQPHRDRFSLGRISLWPNIAVCGMADVNRQPRAISAFYLFIGRWMVCKRRTQRLMNGQQLAGSRCAEASDDAIFVDDDGRFCLVSAIQ